MSDNKRSGNPNSMFCHSCWWFVHRTADGALDILVGEPTLFKMRSRPKTSSHAWRRFSTLHSSSCSLMHCSSWTWRRAQ